jgi:hypothetical protein
MPDLPTERLWIPGSAARPWNVGHWQSGVMWFDWEEEGVQQLIPVSARPKQIQGDGCYDKEADKVNHDVVFAEPQPNSRLTIVSPKPIPRFVDNNANQNDGHRYNGDPQKAYYQVAYAHPTDAMEVAVSIFHSPENCQKNNCTNADLRSSPLHERPILRDINADNYTSDNDDPEAQVCKRFLPPSHNLPPQSKLQIAGSAERSIRRHLFSRIERAKMRLTTSIVANRVTAQ